MGFASFRLANCHLPISLVAISKSLHLTFDWCFGFEHFEPSLLRISGRQPPQKKHSKPPLQTMTPVVPFQHHSTKTDCQTSLRFAPFLRRSLPLHRRLFSIWPLAKVANPVGGRGRPERPCGRRRRGAADGPSLRAGPRCWPGGVDGSSYSCSSSFSLLPGISGHQASLAVSPPSAGSVCLEIQDVTQNFTKGPGDWFHIAYVWDLGVGLAGGSFVEHLT